jgi:hypothetical protein
MSVLTLAGRCPLLGIEELPRSWNPTVFDLSDLEWVTPFEVAGLAALWTRLDLSGATPTVVLPRDAEVRAYLVDMGLDAAIPADWGPGGGSRVEPPWLPLTRIVASEEWDELLIELWPAAAAILNDPKVTLPTMEMMSELVDNAATHGRSDAGAFVCAQRYTGATSGLAAGIWVGIADSGIGVPAHLRRNPKYSKHDDDSDLIRLARQPWVTGTTERRGWGLVEAFADAAKAGPSRLVIRSGRGQGEFLLQRDRRVSARYRALTPSVPGTWIHVRIETA